ncbi:MAG: hypothetical protein Q4D20_00860 [Clostridia bacterium]|nr:hypothetical protein [Clostridia bacterium]
MKKLKSAVALFLVALLFLSVFSVGTFAENENAYPESEHYYKDNYYNEWTYIYPKKADFLFVTFSEKTKTERGGDFDDCLYFDGESVTVEDVMDKWNEHLKIGDYISVFTSDGELFGVYQGDELSGETLCIPGNSFTITLTTDSSIRAYGFKIDSVSNEAPEGMSTVVYDFGNGVKDVAFITERDVEVNGGIVLCGGFYGCISNGAATIGFEDEDGNVYYYDASSVRNIVVPAETGADGKLESIYRFKAVKTPVTLEKSDVYSFTNSYDYFDLDEKGRYCMKKEDYFRLVASACKIHGVGPYALPAAVLTSVLICYPAFPWNGSCIGFTTTVCLQKKGIFDVVKTQEGATCVNDLKPTSDLISLLNYYNGQASLMTVTKNQSNKKTPKEFSRQLKKMFESAESGNLVLLEYIIGDCDDYHGLAISGAYTDEYGRHVLLCYDDNDERYGNYAIASVCLIEPDFSAIYTDEYGELETIFWTDEFESYRSIDYNGENNSIKHYWKEYFTRILKLLKEWFELFVGLFK